MVARARFGELEHHDLRDHLCAVRVGHDKIATACAKFRSCSHVAVIRAYAPEGSRTVGVWEAGIALGKRIGSLSPEATDLSGGF
jgi:hypothetical protein